MFSIRLPDFRPWWSRIGPTAHYLVQTEAHVYALAVAASTLLAFYPFVLVLIAFCRDVLHWPAAQRAVTLAIEDFFYGTPAALITRNLESWMVPKLGGISMLLLLITANGIFEPMEVALNRAWGVAKNRSYLKNQLISLGLIFACGVLALVSLMLTADIIGGNANVGSWPEVLFFKLAALPTSMLALFLVYWLLPNRPIEARRVIPVAIVVGLILESLKYINILISSWFAAKMAREYGIFKVSATILLWSFISAMIVLAGAHWTARHEKHDPLS